MTKTINNSKIRNHNSKRIKRILKSSAKTLELDRRIKNNSFYILNFHFDF